PAEVTTRPPPQNVAHGLINDLRVGGTATAAGPARGRRRHPGGADFLSQHWVGGQIGERLRHVLSHRLAAGARTVTIRGGTPPRAYLTDILRGGVDGHWLSGDRLAAFCLHGDDVTAALLQAGREEAILAGHDAGDLVRPVEDVDDAARHRIPVLVDRLAHDGVLVRQRDGG